MWGSKSGCGSCGLFKEDVTENLCGSCREAQQVHPNSYRDKLNEVEPGLWVGDIGAATDRRLLEHLGFTHIVDASNGHNALRLPSIRYLEVPLTDIDASQLLPHLAPVVSFIDAARAETPNAQVLVHCFRGCSRSVSLAVAYMLSPNGSTAEQALRQLQLARPSALPNRGFMMQLEQLNHQSYQRSDVASPPKYESVTSSAKQDYSFLF